MRLPSCRFKRANVRSPDICRTRPDAIYRRRAAVDPLSLSTGQGSWRMPWCQPVHRLVLPGRPCAQWPCSSSPEGSWQTALRLIFKARLGCCGHRNIRFVNRSFCKDRGAHRRDAVGYRRRGTDAPRERQTGHSGGWDVRAYLGRADLGPRGEALVDSLLSRIDPDTRRRILVARIRRQIAGGCAASRDLRGTAA